MKLRRFFWQSLTAFSILLIAHVATLAVALEVFKTFWVSIAISLAVAIGLGVYLALRLSRPLENLRGRVSQVASGHLNEVVDLSGNETTEIHDISVHMDAIAAQLNSRIQLIEHQKEEQEAILQSLDEGLIAIDSDRRVMHLNPAARRIFPGLSGASVGRRIEEVIRHVDLQELILRSLQEREPVDADLEFLGEKSRYVRVRTSLLKSQDNPYRGLVLAVSDVTRIRQLEGMRKNFVANVSHELRTPLTSIQGFAETLMNPKVQDPKEIRKFTEIIQRHATRLSRIIEDILALSRIERDSESHHLDKKQESVRSILEAAAELCWVRAEAKQSQLKVQVQQDFQIECDRYLIEQALVNLIDNAIRYSDLNKSIHLSAVDLPNEQVITVRDEGSGIPENQLEKIFERFYRVDRARSRELGGTGLGLSIVKHIMLAHGGSVRVKSVLGQGTEFSLHFVKNI